VLGRGVVNRLKVSLNGGGANVNRDTPSYQRGGAVGYLIVLFLVLCRVGAKRSHASVDYGADQATLNPLHHSAFSRANESFLRALVAIFISGVGFTLASIGLMGMKYLPEGSLWDVSLIEFGMTGDRALTISIGLATLVAALSIALVAEDRGQATVLERHFANKSLWAERTSLACVLSAGLALTSSTALLMSSPPRDQWFASLMASAIAIVSAVLAAAVTSWHGREEVERWETQKALVRVDGIVRELDSRSIPSNSRSRRSYVLFVAMSAIGTAMAIYVLVSIAYLSEGSVIKAPTLDNLRPTIGVGLIVWLQVATVQSSWRTQFSSSRLDRLIGWFPSVFFQILYTVGFLAGALEGGQPTDWARFGTVWVATVPTPLVALWAARSHGKGPARFAVTRLLDAARKRADALRRSLRESDL